MKCIANGVIAAGLLFAAGVVSAAESVQVRDAWIREAPANAKVLGGFATIENRTNTPRTLVAARSAVAEKVELHKSITENNVAKMVAVDAIEIPANGEVKLQPGGLHLMFIGPKKAVKAGDKVEVTLEFKDGTKMPVNFEVRRGEGMMMDHTSMGHGAMNHGAMNHNGMGGMGQGAKQ